MKARLGYPMSGWSPHSHQRALEVNDVVILVPNRGRNHYAIMWYCEQCGQFMNDNGAWVIDNSYFTSVCMETPVTWP